MKNLMTLSASALCASMTRDENIDISMVGFDDNIQTLLGTGLEDMAVERGVEATQDALLSISRCSKRLRPKVAVHWMQLWDWPATSMSIKSSISPSSPICLRTCGRTRLGRLC